MGIYYYYYIMPTIIKVLGIIMHVIRHIIILLLRIIRPAASKNIAFKCKIIMDDMHVLTAYQYLSPYSIL